ncbi:TPA: transcriptional regulator [Candidatus Bathyarchaeota archaeon]|nr:transcriptional regulator [Candidatus Bathyarchaeota archaeon]
MEMPDYKQAMKIKNSRRVLEALAMKGGVANFAEIEKQSGVKGSVLIHHLNRLQRLRIIEKEARGTYRLKYKTPLCFIYETEKPIDIAYFSLLGRREERTKPETEFAIELLTREGYKPKIKYVATSPEALQTWKDLKLPYHWILCYEDEIINVDAVKDKVKPQLLSLLKDYLVIMDCTSATKPATIAYYELAQTLWTPLIYVYEDTKELKWLISKETIKERLTQIT